MQKAFITFFCFIAVSVFSYAQMKIKGNESGILTLGVRNSLSAFSDADASGLGFGGHFRLRAGKKINTEWFADYTNNDIQGIAKRSDMHIGWSVMFYPLNKNLLNEKLVPYFMAGHCFDYTRLKENDKPLLGITGSSIERWSSAVQAGMGLHYLVSERVDITVSTQYMSHLGNDIHTEIHEHRLGKEIHFEHRHGGSLEGHLFFILSLNFNLIDLW